MRTLARPDWNEIIDNQEKAQGNRNMFALRRWAQNKNILCPILLVFVSYI